MTYGVTLMGSAVPPFPWPRNGYKTTTHWKKVFLWTPVMTKDAGWCWLVYAHQKIDKKHNEYCHQYFERDEYIRTKEELFLELL